MKPDRILSLTCKYDDETADWTVITSDSGAALGEPRVHVSEYATEGLSIEGPLDHQWLRDALVTLLEAL